MIDRILTALIDNPQGLTIAQLPDGAGRELGPLLGDGRVTLDPSSGVDVYRLGAPKEAPKPAPKRRTGLSLADTDALRKMLGLGEDADADAIVRTMALWLDGVRTLDNIVEAYGYDGLCDDDNVSPADALLAKARAGELRPAKAAPARPAILDGGVVGTWAAPTLPEGWRARYERTAPSGVDLAVVPNSAGWSWSIIDGAQTLARGVVEVDDPAKAIGCCDAVAAVLA